MAKKYYIKKQTKLNKVRVAYEKLKNGITNTDSKGSK